MCIACARLTTTPVEFVHSNTTYVAKIVIRPIFVTHFTIIYHFFVILIVPSVLTVKRQFSLPHFAITTLILVDIHTFSSILNYRTQDWPRRPKQSTTTHYGDKSQWHRWGQAWRWRWWRKCLWIICCWFNLVYFHSFDHLHLPFLPLCLCPYGSSK